MRLNKNEFLPYAPDEEGSVRINHTSSYCSGSSGSLKITRTDDDRVYAKCYRCGRFGSDSGGLAAYGSYARMVGSRRRKSIPSRLEMPRDFTQNIAEMPVTVRAKLNKYGVGQNLVNRYGLGWSERWERFIFPVYRGGELLGFQARYYGDDDLPKYITRYKNDSDLWAYFTCDDSHSLDGCVIVEDMFSAIRCANDIDSVALLGTEMGDKCLDHVTNIHDKFLVFLDDDNLNVKKKAVVIKNRLTMIGKSVKIFTSCGTDPKEYSTHTLTDILTKQMRL